MKTTAIIAAVLLVASPATAQPTTRDDFGSGAFGLERNPPPPPSLPPIEADALGKVLVVATSGLSSGNSIAGNVGGAAILYSVASDRSANLTVAGDQGINRLTLPPLPSGESLDVTLLITPLSTAVNRAGSNQAAFPAGPNIGNTDPTQIRDATLTTGGLLKGLDTAGFASPGPAIVTTQLVDLAPDVDRVVDQFIVDPDSNLRIIRAPTDLTAAELIALDAATPITTANGIQTALSSLSVQDVSLNAVLDSLRIATQKVGVVDISTLSASLVESGFHLKTITNAGIPNATMLDMRTTPTLAVINGGAGKTAFLPGKEFAFQDSLVVALKQTDSTKPTRFIGITTIDDKPSIGSLAIDPKVGGEARLVRHTAELIKRGMAVNVTPDTDLCGAFAKQSAATPATSGPSICAPPNLDFQIAPDAAELLHRANICDFTEASHANPSPCGLNATPSIKPIGVVENPLRDLKGVDFPVPNNLEEYVGIFQIQPPQVKPPTIPSLNLPPTGLGSLEGISAPNVPHASIPEIPVPETDTSFLAALAEHWQAPALPELAPIVPTDAATGLLGTAMNAFGTGLTFVPVDAVQKIPLGLTSELKVRFVGAKGSLFSASGISGVVATLTGSDSLGLSSASSAQTSNENGYTVFSVPGFGAWSLDATHDKYKPVHGTGSSKAPGGSNGQQYTMHAADAGFDGGKAREYSGTILLALLLVGLVVVLVRRRKKGAF